MKKILSLLLVLVLVLSMAACGNNPDPTDPPKPTDPTVPSTEKPTDAPTDPTDAPTDPTDEVTDPTDGAAALTMLNLAFGTDFVSLYNDDMGGMFIDATIDGVRKAATLDVANLATIEAALNESGLLALDGAAEWGEETGKTASFYAAYADWSSKSANYEGVDAPEAFATGFATVKAAIVTLLADVPVYVPEAQVIGEMDEDLKTEMLAIVNNAGLNNLDMMAVMGIPTEDAESFCFSAGLSTMNGVTAGVNCTSMMMGGAVYSLVIVKADDTAAVAADFEANLDWNKWVCVRPSNAIIATKGNMVVCLMADASMYAGTVASMQSAGWTTVNELTDPGM